MQPKSRKAPPRKRAPREVSPLTILKRRLTREGYREVRDVPEHGLCGLRDFLFTTGLVTGLTESGYKGRYCYEYLKDASAGLAAWDGAGDPLGPWVKHKAANGRDRLGPGLTIEEIGHDTMAVTIPVARPDVTPA